MFQIVSQGNQNLCNENLKINLVKIMFMKETCYSNKYILKGT